MRMKKEKTGQISGQRHSSASNYEMNSQSGMLQDHSDEYILELFEKMLVSELFWVFIIKSHITDLQCSGSFINLSDHMQADFTHMT